MFGLGMPELVIIMGITFLVFGGKKLPELGAGLGKGIRSFKTGLREVEGAVPGLTEAKDLKRELEETVSLSARNSGA